MELGEIIAKYRKELKINQAELAERLNVEGLQVSNQAVSKWEIGATQPSAKQFLILCRVLGIRDINGTFMNSENGILYGLNEEGRNKALDYIELLRLSGKYNPENRRAGIVRSLPLYSLAVSAGTGQFLDGEDYEMVEVGAEVPDGANFGVRIAGNSMEPKFHDGETVWVHQQRSLMSGEIGIFLYDGSAYLKQLTAENETVSLHSLNPDYSDIIISPELPRRVLGKVLR